MEIVSMNTSSFWKGEAAVRGQVEDQGQVYKTTVYIRNGQVQDYSCTCAEGNSYRGLCPHGKALFASYKERESEAAQPVVHTSPAVHTLVREYTNRQVAELTAAEERGQVRLVPSLLLEQDQVRLSLQVGRDRLYSLRDLSGFCAAVEEGARREYGKGLSFYHCREAFHSDSQPLLSLVLNLAEGQKPAETLLLSRTNRDRFFARMEGRQVELRLPGGAKRELLVVRQNPVLALTAARQGRDGAQVTLTGIRPEDGSGVCAVEACIPGAGGLYLAAGRLLYCGSREYQEAAGAFLEYILREPGQTITAAARDLPLLEQRVLSALRPFSCMEEKQITLADYRPQPLRARFCFEAGDRGELWLEPWFSYGAYQFCPLEEEKLPRLICRDVPGEFRISQVIKRYFRYRDGTDGRLVIRGDEEALYRLLDQGMTELGALGEICLSESMKGWQVIPAPQVRLRVSGGGPGEGWLSLTVDADGLGGQEIGKILAAYRQKKHYFRLKTGAFLRLGDDGGLRVVSRMAEELGLGRRELQSGEIRLPVYRAFYLEQLLKEGRGIRDTWDQQLQTLMRGVEAAGDGDAPVPAGLQAVLREYQKAGFRWMKTLARYGFGGILADDMGLGKTIQVIALLEDAAARPGPPSIVICPASLVYNWLQELGRFAPELRAAAVAGSAGEREALLQAVREHRPQYDVFVTSYDLLRRDLLLYRELSFRFQIIDEAQYIKNPATQCAKSVKALRAEARFALTGTPIENRLSELWSVFDYLMPGFLFTLSGFRRTYELPIAQEGDGKALDRLKRLIRPFVLRRVKKDVLKELPDKVEQVVYSAFDEEQRRLYTANALLLKEKLERGAADERERLQILSDLLRLRQICCDPRLCYGNYRGGSAKLETFTALVRRAAEGAHRILVFSQFTSMLAILEKRLAKEKIPCLKLTGDTPREEREKLVEQFQQGAVPVFLISLKAGGTGLNLTAADLVIHYDPWWNVASQNQATDRTHRIGQEKQVTVYRLIASNTIEENIMKLQASKGRLADQVVTGEQAPLSKLSLKELAGLL